MRVDSLGDGLRHLRILDFAQGRVRQKTRLL